MFAALVPITDVDAAQAAIPPHLEQGREVGAIPASCLFRMKAINQEIGEEAGLQWVFIPSRNVSDFVYWKVAFPGRVVAQFRFDEPNQWGEWLEKVNALMAEDLFTRTVIDRMRC